ILGIDLVLEGGVKLAASQPDQPVGEALEDSTGGRVVAGAQAGEPFPEGIVHGAHSPRTPLSEARGHSGSRFSLWPNTPIPGAPRPSSPAGKGGRKRERPPPPRFPATRAGLPGR